jgi:hypothetical protein
MQPVEVTVKPPRTPRIAKSRRVRLIVEEQPAPGKAKEIEAGPISKQIITQ